MPEYKIYCLDEGGRIVSRHDIQCSNDHEAFKKAHEFCAAYDVEVWRGTSRTLTLAKGSKILPKQ
ncbi:MAG TPA: hypothetical protein VMU22_03425 [Rhizomicrobium sp.]|nr:hypothetical protein [Rhizomicrobium sp.]